MAWHGRLFYGQAQLSMGKMPMPRWLSYRTSQWRIGMSLKF